MRNYVLIWKKFDTIRNNYMKSVIKFKDMLILSFIVSNFRGNFSSVNTYSTKNMKENTQTPS